MMLRKCCNGFSVKASSGVLGERVYIPLQKGNVWLNETLCFFLSKCAFCYDVAQYFHCLFGSLETHCKNNIKKGKKTHTTFFFFFAIKVYKTDYISIKCWKWVVIEFLGMAPELCGVVRCGQVRLGWVRFESVLD